MASNSELEQADSTATIRLLQGKYGHNKGSIHAVVGETKSRLFWLLQSGHCVHKDHKGIGWEWASLGPIPTGGRVDSLSSSSNSSSSGGKRKRGEPDSLTSNALSLGSRLLGIAAEHPTEFLDVVKTIEECERLTALKSKKAQDVEPSTSSSATHSESHRLTVFKDLGLDDRHQEAENGSTATDADSVGASGSTADRSSTRDPGRQTFEATRSSVFDRLGPARAFGGDNAAQAEPQPLYLGQAGPCFLAAALWCFDVRIVDKHDRPVTECTMQRRGACERPHDEESCLMLWNSNSERGVKFRQQLKAYVKLVMDNHMREPSKEQLQEAGVLPNWNAQKKLKSKDRGETDVLLQKQSGVSWQASRQQNRRPDERSRRSVSVFADRASGGRRNVAFTAVLDGSAVLTDGASYQSSASSTLDSGSDGGCVKCQEARSLTAADQQAVVTHGMTPKPAHRHCHRCGAVARADDPDICPACARPSICPARTLATAQQEPTTVGSESSDSGSSSDDGDLPFYWCSECRDVVVQGGGGILPCSTCRGNRSYRPDDSVALLGLRTKNYNHRVGVIVNTVQRENGIRYGVLLAGETVPVAIRPDNLRPVNYSAMFAAPGHRDRPQERSGNSTAQVVVFKEADVQTEGAHYQSSEWRTVPEENKDYGSVACNIVLNPRTGMIMDSDDGAEKGTINKPGEGVVARQTRPDTDQPERMCTCCEWCKLPNGQLELPCSRSCCQGKVAICIKHGIGVKEAATADAALPQCTEQQCFGRSGCTEQLEWGTQVICQMSARPALTGYEYNRKARRRLKEFMDDNFRHRPYTKLRLPNADEHEANGAFDEPYVSPYVAYVPWDPTTYWAVEYNHVFTCRGSCGCSCNPTNRENALHIACLHEGDEEAPLPQACGEVNVIEQERYIHDQDCTGGCDNRCVERYEIREAARVEQYRIQEALRSARASTEVPDPRTGHGGWGSSSRGDGVAVGGWGRPGEHRVNGGWGASSPDIWNTTASGDGWGETVSGQQNLDSWGRRASGNVGGWGSNTAPVDNSIGGWGSNTAPVDNSGSGWGTLASGVSRPQDVSANNAHRETAEDGSHMTEIVVVRAGTEIKVEMCRGLYADSDASSECYDSEERRWRKHGDEPGTSASSDSDEGSDDVSTSGGCAEIKIRPRELKEESQAGWQFNMVVIDKKVSEWEGASYTSAATESGSSTTIAQVASKVESKATEVQSSQAQPECVGADLAQRSENQESDRTVRSSSKNDNHKLCAEVHQALCDAIAPEKDAGQICGLHAPPCSCGVLAEWLRTPLSLASTGRGEVLGDFCIEMSKVIEEHLDGKSCVDGYFMYEAPRLSVTSKDFKANIEEIVSALIQVRDEARETCHSPVGDPIVRARNGVRLRRIMHRTMIQLPLHRRKLRRQRCVGPLSAHSLRKSRLRQTTSLR